MGKENVIGHQDVQQRKKVEEDLHQGENLVDGLQREKAEEGVHQRENQEDVHQEEGFQVEKGVQQRKKRNLVENGHNDIKKVLTAEIQKDLVKNNIVNMVEKRNQQKKENKKYN